MPDFDLNQNPAEMADDLDEFGDPKQPETGNTTPEPEQEQDQQPATETIEQPETPSEPEQSEQPEVQPEPEKKPTQSPEENARFAEQRRLAEQRQREKIEVEIRANDPAFKMAETLSKVYGKPVEQLYTEMQEALLQKEAEQRGVPVEVIKQINDSTQRTSQLEQQLLQMQFQNWKQRVDVEASTLKNEYPMLSEQDMTEAQNYLLTTLRNPEIPLEQAVQALHGKKIIEGLRNAAKQEALAELGGRGKSPLPVQPGKQTPAATLSADERYVAKNFFGMTDEEYAKWKQGG